MVIYDTNFQIEKKVRILKTVEQAHEAGISCMAHGRSVDNLYIITGSFDRTVKIWDEKGGLLHKLDKFV